jgi:hypothetical protein
MKKRSKSYSQSKIKSRGMAYLMWLFLGFHHAYIGNWGRQLLLLLMPVSGFLIFMLTSGRSEFAATAGIWLFALSVLWYLLDPFFIPSYVNSKNRELAEEMEDFKRMERLEMASMLLNQKRDSQ